jgi:aminoglycoside/choline kinase family phosphotransferase
VSSPLPEEAARCLREWLGEGWTAHPLAGDASVRAYFRVASPDGKTYILQYYPEEVRGQLRRFLGAYEAVAPHGKLPLVLQHTDMTVLQDDVGDRTLFDVLHEDRDEGLRLYGAAIDLLVKFQNAQCELNPPFTAESFLVELEMAREFYAEKLMGSTTSAALQPYMKMLSEKVARHPYVLCHRDFHGQNLHLHDDVVYLIDYQDLRQGPDTYDLASLLRDRGVARIIGDAGELELLEQYRRLRNADAGIHDRYFETLLQRSIKILGTFSKQPIVRGKMHYLDFIPPTLESVRRCLDELPEFAPVASLLPMDFDLERARARARELNEQQ